LIDALEKQRAEVKKNENSYKPRVVETYAREAVDTRHARVFFSLILFLAKMRHDSQCLTVLERGEALGKQTERYMDMSTISWTLRARGQSFLTTKKT